MKPKISTKELKTYRYFSRQNSVSSRSFEPFKLSSILLAVYIFTIVAWSQASGESATYSKFVGLAMVYMFAAEILLNHSRKIYFPKIAVIFAAFVVWNVLSIQWAGNIARATTTILTLFQLLVFSIVAINILILRKSLVPAIVGFLVGVVWAIVRAFMANNYKFIQDSNVRFGSVLVNPNSYAVALTVGLLMALYVYSNVNRLFQIFLLGYSLIAIQQIYFFTGSRKGMLAVIFIFSAYLGLVWGLKLRHSRRYLLIIPIGLLALYGLSDWLINSSPFSERLLDYQADASFQARDNMVDFGLERWKKKPLFGYGANQYRILYQSALGADSYSHNNYIELLVNLGILGVIIYYIPFLIIGLSVWRLFLTGRIAVAEFSWTITTLVLLLIWDFAMVSYYEKIHWMMLSVLTAHNEILKHR